MELSFINLLLVLLSAWAAGGLATRLGYPSIIGELAAGILLGPGLLGLLQGDLALTTLAELGVFLMMLYIGMEIDHRDLGASSWGGLLAALGSFLTPFGLGFYAARYFGENTGAALFLGLAMGVTSLATKSRILNDLKLFGTRVANTMIAGALISDTIALIAFTGILGIVETDSLQVRTLVVLGGKALLFFAVATFIGLKIFPYLFAGIKKLGFEERTSNFTFVVLVGLVFAEMAELADLHSIVGAFLAGLFLREGVLRRKLSHDISSVVHDLSIGFLAPIFFVTVGFHVRFGVVAEQPAFFFGVVGLAMFGKIFGTMLFYSLTRRNWREGLAIGCGMNGGGAVEIIIAEIALKAGIITEDLFSVLVLLAFFTTTSVPFLLKFSVGWLRSRGELVSERPPDGKTIIFGAGALGIALGKLLPKKENIIFIDRNADHCNGAKALGFQAIQGDGLRSETLAEAHAEVAVRYIAFLPNTEINLLAAQFARESFNIPQVYALARIDLAHRDQKFAAHIAELGIRLIGSNGTRLENWDHWVAAGQTQLEDISIEREMSYEVASDLFGLGSQNLPLLLRRDGEVTPLDSQQSFRPGDTIVTLRLIPAREEHEEGGILRPVAKSARSAAFIDCEEGVSKEQLFRRVSDHFSTICDSSSERIYAQFKERENQGVTVIAPKIAVPHIIIDAPGRFEIAVVRSLVGLPFDKGAAPIHAMLFLAVSKDRRNEHLHALAEIVSLIKGTNFMEEWMSASDTEVLRNFIMAVNPKIPQP